MNVITKLGSNFAGFLSPTQEKRDAAAESVSSLARANILGRLSKMQAAAAKSATAAESTTAKAATTKASTTDDSTSTSSSSTLDQDAFLQLLVTQMQYQDPMNPVDNSEMLAQLAQFSSLEQISQLNDTMEFVSGNIDQLNFINASALVGRNVTGLNTDGTLVEGTVESVYMQDSVVYLSVDGEIMSMAGVASIDES